MTNRIDDNSFASACYNQNTIAELEQALTEGADEGDMRTWSLTAGEWRAQIEQALAWKCEAVATDAE